MIHDAPSNVLFEEVYYNSIYISGTDFSFFKSSRSKISSFRERMMQFRTALALKILSLFNYIKALGLWTATELLQTPVR